MIPRKEDGMATGLVKANALIWDQCPPTTKRKLEQLPTYVAMNHNKNPVTLLTKMQTLCAGGRPTVNPFTVWCS